ncbi:MAG: C39 family peptidase [bacterium]
MKKVTALCIKKVYLLLLIFLYANNCTGTAHKVIQTNTKNHKITRKRPRKRRKRIPRRTKNRSKPRRPARRTKRFLRRSNLRHINQRLIQRENPPEFSKTISHFIQPTEAPEINNQKPYMWQSQSQIPFNELIVSWNAKRPLTGYMTLWVRVKHQDWSPWHKIAEWGQNYQLSFANTRNQFVHTAYVKIVTKQGRFANAFGIKALFHNGAQKQDLHALFACCSNLKKFQGNKTSFNQPSVTISGITAQSQKVLDHARTGDLCYPTSMSMIVNYFTSILNKDKHPCSLSNFAVDFAEKVHDLRLDIFGNWLLNTAQAYDASGGDVFYRAERLRNFNDIYNRLINKIPVAVSVRKLHGGATPYSKGHLITIIGWNNETQSVICLDPAFRSNKAVHKSYKLNYFARAWARQSNLSYIPLPKKDIWLKFCQNMNPFPKTI